MRPPFPVPTGLEIRYDPELVADAEFLPYLPEAFRTPEQRLFRPVRAGRFLVSLQASPNHACHPRRVVPAGEVRAWEVLIYYDTGLRVTEATEPWLLDDHLWSEYFRDGVGRHVPAEAIQPLLDCLALGPARYYQTQEIFAAEDD